MNWLRSFVALLFPHQCVVCSRVLQEGEEAICMQCNMDMPRTNYHLYKDNAVERLFWGKMPLERATSYFHYQKGSPYRYILYKLKYEGRKDIGETMGRFLAAELMVAHFFDDVDLIMPTPLHVRRQKQRGYNQSECIARGISAVTGISVDTSSMVRKRHTETQTRKSTYGRFENVEGIFLLNNPTTFTRKHIVLVDDVLTTGATITACADAFAGVEGVRISVLTVAVAS